MKQSIKAELLGHIFPFWHGLRDDINGGFCGGVSFDLAKEPNAEKGCILNSRIMWFFATLARTFATSPDAEERRIAALALEDATHAYAFLKEHCMDKTYGGVYWSLHADGTVLDETKHTYNQGFSVYALSAYYRATGDAEALALAKEMYQLIEAKCKDEGGYLEAFSRDFKPQSNEKLSENGVIATRTMNTLLHVFEGYAGLYEASSDPAVAQSLREMLEIFAEKIYNPDLHRQEVFFDADYQSILDLHSYGHDIESSWLIDWGCDLLEDDALSAKIHAINDDLLDCSHRKAFEQGYHQAIFYNENEKGVDNKTRVWWVQAEAVLGYYNGYQKHPEKMEYRAAAEDLWAYIQESVIDKRPGGEWFWDLDEYDEPTSKKQIVEPWKCPYHNGRMCFELIRRIQE